MVGARLVGGVTRYFLPDSLTKFSFKVAKPLKYSRSAVALILLSGFKVADVKSGGGGGGGGGIYYTGYIILVFHHREHGIKQCRPLNGLFV